MSLTIFVIYIILALSHISTTSASYYKRAGGSGTSLYAYGTNISGIEIFYGDGLAYIGSSAPSWLSVPSNITFTTYGEATTTPWTVTSNTSTFSGNPKLYIITTSGSFSQVGFLSTNDTASAGQTTSGFTFFGTSVAYAANDSDYQMKFWATSTNTTGVWKLMWNANGNLESNSVPVVLKSTPPVSLTVLDGED